MTNTVTMMEKVTKIMMKSRYSPISGMTWRHVGDDPVTESMPVFIYIYLPDKEANPPLRMRG